GYGGIAAVGGIGFWRGLRLLHTGVLTRSEAPYWGGLVTASKALTVLAEAALLAAMASRRVRWPLAQACLAALLAFLVFYGSLSAQYLLWVVPFGVWLPDRFAAVHGIVSTMALVGLYSFLAPAILYPRPSGILARPQAATFDDGPHLPAGYTYLKLGDHRLNPEHPPLVKTLAALPLLFMDVTIKPDDEAWALRRQWEFGKRFLYRWNDADRLLFWGRL